MANLQIARWLQLKANARAAAASACGAFAQRGMEFMALARHRAEEPEQARTSPAASDIAGAMSVLREKATQCGACSASPTARVALGCMARTMLAAMASSGSAEEVSLAKARTFRVYTE